METTKSNLGFDIAVIGGGHAGIEAVNISSKLGLKVALFSMPKVELGSTPCNPSIGGVGKGQVVREIDCLGGAMGILADETGIQYRTLNTSKGHAVYSTRVQIDKKAYSEKATEYLYSLDNTFIFLEKIIRFDKIIDGGFIIQSDSGKSFQAKKVVITAGTFLNGKLHCGEANRVGGRDGCESSTDLGSLIKNSKLGIRFKTGTPARLYKDSINWSALVEQKSELDTMSFHLMNDWSYRGKKQVSCFIGHTNKDTIDIIQKNLYRSPMFNGSIGAVGARYCPSIEDKAHRYPERFKHHVFLEPEGLDSDLVYPSGVSSSLPQEIQLDFLRTIKGLEECEIASYGYAVEYDVIDTSKLSSTLEHQEIEGLFFAGQINGTSGYEEAAGQGLVAGINACLSVTNPGERFVLDRRDSYIGVMIEDLVFSQRDEPYRLFTARAENRLGMREDNTWLRMLPYRSKLGINDSLSRYMAHSIDGYSYLSDFISKHMEELSLQSYEDFRFQLSRIGVIENDMITYSLFVDRKYSGYIKRQDSQLNKFSKIDQVKLNPNIFVNNDNISFECRQRISQLRPESFGQLKKIKGLRASTIAYIAGHLRN
jgi:tRNA uridine 5-carboxymethylaminomethyl modification enzyme